MNNRNYASITTLISIALLPQLFFWWLAPQSAGCYWAVFAFGTFLTLAIPVTCFITYFSSSIRESAGLFIIGGVLELIVLAASAILLIFDVSLRTTLFVYGIILIVGIMALVPAIHSVIRGRFAFESGPVNNPAVDYRNMRDFAPTDYGDGFEMPVTAPQINVNRVSNTTSTTNTRRPLPPRY